MVPPILLSKITNVNKLHDVLLETGIEFKITELSKEVDVIAK